MFEAHIFAAKQVPTPRELHCLVAHLSDKQDVSVRLKRNGRIISVIALAGGILPKDVPLETNAFTYKRTEPVADYSACTGDFATISMTLCYVIKRTRAGERRNVTEAPFDAYGKLKPRCRDHFLRYLEQATGLTGLVDGSAEFGLEPHAMVSDEERRAKVWFTGACDIVIRAKVGDAGVFNTLAGRAIGKRRSYGFGGVSCDDIEAGAESVEPAEALESV